METPLTPTDVATLSRIAATLAAPLSELVQKLLRERGKLRVTARALLCRLPGTLPEAQTLSNLIGPPS